MCARICWQSLFDNSLYKFHFVPFTCVQHLTYTLILPHLITCHHQLVYLFLSFRQDSVAGLLKNMFEGERSEASFVNGTQVLLTLLETRRSG